jgi:4'-phosphopantetheinyl transferase
MTCAPGALQFSYSPYGKPSVVATTVRFNLSHSHTIAALALTRDYEIGVDVEQVRPIKEDISGRFFSPRENAALSALPEQEQTGAFFRCWARKEAIVKAIGEGLSHPLDSFDVSIGVNQPAVVERFEGEADARKIWRLAHFEPAPGYAGAVACRTGGAPICIRQV